MLTQVVWMMTIEVFATNLVLLGSLFQTHIGGVTLPGPLCTCGPTLVLCTMAAQPRLTHLLTEAYALLLSKLAKSAAKIDISGAAAYGHGDSSDCFVK